MVRLRGFVFFPPLTLFSCAERALSKHNVNCSCASQEMPQLQITDQTKHVVLGLEGDKPPTVLSQCIDPSRNLHYWQKNIYSCPLTNTCQFQEKDYFCFVFCHSQKKYKVFISTHENEQSGFVFFSLSHLRLCLSPRVSLWPPGAALPLIQLLTTLH